jgi:hypothetical protein
VLHKFVVRWQDKLFSMCLVKQRSNTLIFVVYYVIKEQNEIQNQHWFNFQIIIFLHLSWKTNHKYDPIDGKSLVKILEYH